MTDFRKHKTVFGITQSESIWPVYETSYNKFWSFSRLLNSKLTLVREWIKPTPPAGEDGIPSAVYGGFISDLTFSNDGRYLLAGSTCSDAYLFDPNTTRPELIIKNACQDAITRVCFTGDTKFIVGSACGSLMLWDARNTKESITSLIGHTKVIRSIDYNRKKDLLVTSSSDDNIRYWNIAKCEVAIQNPTINVVEEEESDHDLLCDVYLTCPNISLACINSSCEKLAFITCSGLLYVVDNLDLSHLKEDMLRFRFDNSLLLQMSWFTPNSALNSRNHLRVIGKDEVIPTACAEVTKVNYMEFHGSSPLLVVRMTTTRKLVHAHEKKEWTCGYSMQDRVDTSALYYSHECMSSFGSDVVQEKLVYLSEEERYSPLREKRLSFSSCGRIIASPTKRSVRLLSFSRQLNLPFDVQKKNHSSPWASATDDFNVFLAIEMPENATICTKFSPRDHLLAVGDINDHVHFFQPVL